MYYKKYISQTKLKNHKISNNNNNNNNFKKIYNEFLFLLNKRLKIYIHLDQLIYKTNIYHIELVLIVYLPI